MTINSKTFQTKLICNIGTFMKSNSAITFTETSNNQTVDKKRPYENILIYTENMYMYLKLHKFHQIIQKENTNDLIEMDKLHIVQSNFNRTETHLKKKINQAALS